MLDYKTINIQDLVLNQGNPRINDHAVDKLVKGIEQYGFISPIIVNKKNNLVLAGHTRIKALLKMEKVDAPVLFVDMDDTTAKAYSIWDNKSAEFADWDMDLLNVEMDLLIADGFDIDLTGFDSDEFGLEEEKDGLTDDDAVPEVPEEPVCKLGDLWLLGDHRVLCGDSTDRVQVARLMGGLKPNAVFTDPPYGIGLDKDKQKIGRSKEYGSVLNDGDSDVAKKVFGLCKSLSIPELYFWGANHYSSCLPDSSCWIVWDKQGGKSVTFADCELCYTNIQKPVRMFTHIWDGFRRDSEKGVKRVHINQKPIKLFIDIWEKFNTGQVILDLFLGSGSTLIACEKTNRKCYGMELDPRYCDVIIKRWEDYTGQKAELTTQ